MTNQRKWSLWIGIFGVVTGLVAIFMGIFFYKHFQQFIYVILGLSLIIFNIFPAIIAGSKMVVEETQRARFAFHIIGICLGAVFIFYHPFYMAIIIGIFELIVPVIQILLSHDKLRRFKIEIPSFVTGAFLLLNLLDIMFQVMVIILGGILIAIGIVFLLLASNLIYFKRNKKANSINAHIEVVDVEPDLIEENNEK
ncbi:MAG: hypothetical protein K6A63_01245 [Acholeplasmatales bacterium]|nr:hypothetical protein [Acholeplasmatales bacterium]